MGGTKMRAKVLIIFTLEILSAQKNMFFELYLQK